MREFFRTTLVWVLVAFVGDTIIGPGIAIRGISPDFSVIALILLALGQGAVPATLAGFLVGLVQDLSNPTLLGLHALCKCGLGFGAGSLRGRLVYGLAVVNGFIIMLAVLLHDLLFLLVQSRLTDEAFVGPFFKQSVPVAVYTGLVGVAVLRLAEYAGILRQED